MITHLYIAARS